MKSLIRQGLTSLVNYEQFGMTVINQAENGREAWEKFQEQPADILLTDINMPQMNGLDLAHLVKEQSPSCHIIFLTGYDDFEFARKAIKLGADDYLLNQAENGREAWEKFQEQPADILLTDINMPQMNGLDLAHLVKEKSPSCHIIFLTGYDDFEFARKAIKLGADDYLLKPFSKDDIEEMLAKVKGKLDKERKKAQVEDLVSHGYSTELEEAIHARLADSQLTLKDLAYQLGFSPSYLSVLIKKKLGLPFQEYLIQERMKKAQLLLLTTDLKIYEIADQVGFEDMNYFSQRFKQVVGVTPRQYKKGEHE